MRSIPPIKLTIKCYVELASIVPIIGRENEKVCN